MPLWFPLFLSSTSSPSLLAFPRSRPRCYVAAFCRRPLNALKRQIKNSRRLEKGRLVALWLLVIVSRVATLWGSLPPTDKKAHLLARHRTPDPGSKSVNSQDTSSELQNDAWCAISLRPEISRRDDLVDGTWALQLTTRPTQLSAIISPDKPYRYPKTPPFVRGPHPSRDFSFFFLWRSAYFSATSTCTNFLSFLFLSLFLWRWMHLHRTPTSSTSFGSPTCPGSTRWRSSLIVHARFRHVMTTLAATFFFFLYKW